MKRSGSHVIRSSVPGLALLTLSCALTACSRTSLNPVDWYHAIEGGRVADERPAPPQADAPYPNLGTVPARPAPIDAAARGAIAQGLVADRTNAQYAASQSPLPPPANPANRPVPPAPRPSGDEAAAASLPAASAPPAAKPPTNPIGPLGPPQSPLPDVPMTAPRRAPTQAVQSSALPAIAAGEGSESPKPSKDVGARPDVVIAQGRPAEPQASLPTVPTTPPPPPLLPGAPGETAPTTPTPAPSMATVSVAPAAPVVKAIPAPAPDLSTAQSGGVLIAFPAGSSDLPPNALVALKVLTQQRAGNAIVVTGYGDVTGTDAVAQSNALPLALERARVVAARLLALGVPPNAIRTNAEAQGRGAAARIVR